MADKKVFARLHFFLASGGKSEQHFLPMWPFTETATEPTTAPATDREAECLTRVRAAKAALDEHDRQMRRFKTEHRIRTDTYGRLLGVESPTLGGRAAIAAQWLPLLKRRDLLVSEWHASLHAWATAKETREREQRKEGAA